MRPVVYSLQARDDFEGIYEYVSVESCARSIGRAVTSRIRRRCERVALLGGVLGTARDDLAQGLRSTPSGAYLIFFRYLPDKLEVVRVVRGERSLADIAYDGDDDSRH